MFSQNRRPVSEFTHLLNNTDYQIIDGVVDFISNESVESHWEKQNEKFLNYDRSLTPFTFLNSIPIDRYIAEKSGLHKLKDAVVLDVGGGTGHFRCSFFMYPEEISYYLLDPNIRLLHDQFIRMYPALLDLPIGHIRCFAEKLPFKDSMADLIVSSSAIDHYVDYKKFIAESIRCLKPGGKILISSHLKNATSASSSIFNGFTENLSRLIFRLRSRVAINDHVHEFESIDSICSALEEAGFEILQQETFKQYFFIVGKKVS